MNELAPLGGIAGVLMGVGWFLKHRTPLTNDWIPVALVVIGGLFSCTLQGWTITNAVEGVSAALISIGVHAGTRSTITATKAEPPTQGLP